MTDSIPVECGLSPRVVFRCDLAEARVATRILRAFLAEQGLDETEQFNCELCLTEACNNAVQYATADGRRQARASRAPRPDVPTCGLTTVMGLAAMVGMAGFEPTTFRSQSGRATNLRHIPCERSLSADAGPTAAARRGPDRLEGPGSISGCPGRRPCGCSSMVEPQSSKLATRVRFPSSAPAFPQARGVNGGESTSLARVAS